MRTKTYTYTTSGTCSKIIEIDINDGLIEDVRFIGGCHGNLQGVAALIRGLDPSQVVDRLKGIKCGHKATSCPDQLATALESIIDKTKN